MNVNEMELLDIQTTKFDVYLNNQLQPFEVEDIIFMPADIIYKMNSNIYWRMFNEWKQQGKE